MQSSNFSHCFPTLSFPASQLREDQTVGTGQGEERERERRRKSPPRLRSLFLLASSCDFLRVKEEEEEEKKENDCEILEKRRSGEANHTSRCFPASSPPSSVWPQRQQQQRQQQQRRQQRRQQQQQQQHIVTKTSMQQIQLDRGKPCSNYPLYLHSSTADSGYVSYE